MEINTLTLNALVARTEGRIASSNVALAIFRDRLLEAGYVCHDRYDQECFVPVQTRFFDVSVDFPKITSASVHSSIRRATYEIEITSLDAFERGALRDD